MAFEGTKTLTEQVVNYLSGQIIRGHLPPGEPIRETDLAEELGVSRTPIREAFRILEKSRLLELLPHRGARVTELSLSTIDWIFDVIEAFGILLIRRAAEAGNERNISDLRKVMSRMAHCANIGDNNAYYQGILDFISATQLSLKNAILDDLIEDIIPSVRRVVYVSIADRSEDLEKNVKMFESVVTAIEAGDADGGEQATLTYLQNVRALALKVFGAKQTSG